MSIDQPLTPSEQVKTEAGHLLEQLMRAHDRENTPCLGSEPGDADSFPTSSDVEDVQAALDAHLIKHRDLLAGMPQWAPFYASIARQLLDAADA